MMKLRYPPYVTIEVTTVCNIIPPCVMCAKHIDPRSGWVNKDAAHFPKELISKLKDVFAEAKVVSLYGIGEPLTCPYLFEFKEYVSEDCHVQFVSNGLLLNKENIDKILDSRIAQIDISLDATTQENYAKIRHGDLQRIVGNISNLIAERTKRNMLFPAVILNMCLMRQNINDLPGLPLLCKQVGANHCYAFHLNTGMAWKYNWFDYEKEHCWHDADHHDLVVKKTFEIAKEVGVSFEFKGKATYNTDYEPPYFTINLPSTIKSPVTSAAPPCKCAMPWDNVIIYKDGSVTNCCWQQGFLGNLYKSSFEEIWYGAIQQRVRRALEQNEFDTVCSGSLVCPPRGRT